MNNISELLLWVLKWLDQNMLFFYVKESILLTYYRKRNFILKSWKLADVDWTDSKNDGRSTSGYFTFVGGNLVT
jgi:hypothetical protein